MAIDQRIVQRDVEQQAAQANDHAWAGAAHAIAVAAQYVIEGNARQAEGDTVQVAHARFDQLWVDFHPVQDRLCAEQQAAAHQSDTECQPQGLACQRTDLVELLCTKALGNLGCGRQQHAGHQQVNRDPDRIAQGHRSQVPWAHPAGHHRIDETHGRGGQLRDDDRHGQAKQPFELQANPGRTGEGGSGEAVSHRIHRRSVQKVLMHKAAHSTPLTQRSGKLPCWGFVNPD
ncbi:hypothetical protein D3C78_1037650 [compost metagenome]